MIKTTRNGNATMVCLDGDANTITAEILAVINSAYRGVARKNPNQASKFRRILIGMLTDPDSPVWAYRPESSGISIVIDKEALKNECK